MYVHLKLNSLGSFSWVPPVSRFWRPGILSVRTGRLYRKHALDLRPKNFLGGIQRIPPDPSNHPKVQSATVTALTSV